MSVPRETLMALVDGELSPAEESRVMAQVAKDPALAAYVEEQKKLRAKLRDEFDPVLGHVVPAKLEEMILSAPRKPQRARRGWLEGLLPRPGHWAPWVAGGAMAAGTALGLLLAPAFDAAPIGSEGGRLIARGELARALSDQLASEQDPAAPPATRIAMTFRSRDGNLCRTFMSESGDNDFAGIACRDGDDWRIALLTPATAPPPGTFQQAGVAMPPILRDGAEAMRAGDPLDAAAERDARDAEWE
jgi:hypothetical protein